MLALSVAATLSLLAAAGSETECCTASYCAACCNKSVGDSCTMDRDETVCCTDITDPKPARFCKVCAGQMTFTAKCSHHSRNGNLGCFSPPELTEPTYKACEGRSRGADCILPPSRGSGPGNMTGHCILHYAHGGLMCLEAVGDGGDCHGLGVGHPCPAGAPEADHLCTHHSRRGNMMCIVPTGFTDSAIVCEGKDDKDFCGYIRDNSHGNTRGYFEGVCTTHGQGHMVCVRPETLPGNEEDPNREASGACRWPSFFGVLLGALTLSGSA